MQYAGTFPASHRAIYHVTRGRISRLISIIRRPRPSGESVVAGVSLSNGRLTGHPPPTDYHKSISADPVCVFSPSLGTVIC